VALVSLIAAIVYALGWTVNAAGAPIWLAGVIAAVAAAAALIPVLARTGPGAAAGYTLACALAAGGWLIYAAASSPRTWIAITAIALLAPALGLLYPVVRRHQRHLAEEARRRAEEERQKADARKWPDLLGRLGHPGISFRAQTATRSGHTITLGLPPSGKVRYGTLAEATERIEIAARLRRGAVRVERGARADEVLLHVAERDVLAETIPLPDDTGPLTVNQPLPVGLHEDGTVCTVTLREVAALIVGLRGSGKALALDTPIPTPTGWTTMGELEAGDVVYDDTGTPCRVTDAWAVRQGRPCYEVELSDGSTITADAEHQWLVDTKRSRMSARRPLLDRRPRKSADPAHWNHGQAYRRIPPEVLTTEAMIGSVRVRTGTNGTADRCESNYSVRVAAALKGGRADLPVPPYTLGAWLGDGGTVTGSITTADHEIIAEIEAEGETAWVVPSTGVTHRAAEGRKGRLDQWPAKERDTLTRSRLASYRIANLNGRLRTVGVLGNKHIPAIYLRASEQQRRALLAGLLDTDGYCARSGAVEFCSTRERLARDVHHLACTLGYKAALRSKTARLYGKDCGMVWTVSFTTADKVFRLTRKASRQVVKERATASNRYITAIRPVPTVPVRCIAVDSPSHLYLVGDACIPTHNSNLINVLIAQLSRCTDAVIFMIDLKGGRTALPWLRPWLQGRGGRPVIDWVATTREEAERMLRAVLRGIDARAHSGAGGEKITPSAGLPAVILIVEEVAVIFGMNSGPRTSFEGTTNATLAGLGTQVTQLGRSEAIDPVLVTQRGAVTMLGSGDLKSQCRLRIGLGVATEADARLVIPDDLHIAADLARLQHPGSGIVQSREGRPVPVKFYRLDHDRIAGIADRLAASRPAVDHVLTEALGADYRHRWSAERAGHLHGIGTHANGAHTSHLPGGQAAPARARGGNTDREFAEIVAGLDSGAAAAPVRKRMLEILGSTGVMGATSTRLLAMLRAEGIAPARQALDRWLEEEEMAGRVKRASHGRWKTQ